MEAKDKQPSQGKVKSMWTFRERGVGREKEGEDGRRDAAGASGRENEEVHGGKRKGASSHGSASDQVQRLCRHQVCKLVV